MTEVEKVPATRSECAGTPAINRRTVEDMQQNEKPNFLYYTDWAEQLLTFPADLRLKIDDAVKRYVLYGEEPTDREVLYSMFGLMRTQIDRDRAKYADVCNKNSENANKRWRTERMRSHTSGCGRIRSNAVDADNDNDNDNDDENIKKLSNESKESADKPRRGTTKRAAFVVPALEIVKDYFSKIHGTDTDAESFYDHFEANGWQVSGKSPMKNWQAAARNWIRRKSEFNKPANTPNHETRKYNFL